MSTRVGLTVIKAMEYRGDADEEWSNHYWFTGSPPVDAPSWKTFADAFIAVEHTCYADTSRVVRAYGYADNADKTFAVWSHDYDAAGSPPVGILQPDSIPGQRFSGDQAGFIFWRTTRRNTRGKWVYLRKYMHDGWLSDADADAVGGTTEQAWRTFADAISTAPGIQGRVLTGRVIDEVFQAQDASHWITTRTLKRRGKRPAPATP